MDLKLGPAREVKVIDESKGEIQAVFSTLKVIDKDGDVTLPGAFGEQKVRISAYNHRSWADELPIGKGSIIESGDEAVLNGQFFMDVPKARDTFNTIKQLGELMEWSYGYDILERGDGTWPENDEKGQSVQLLKKLKVHEVSPVILGAGENTRTLSAKSAKIRLKQALTEEQIDAAQAVIADILELLKDEDNPPQQADVDNLIDKLEQAIGVQETSMLSDTGPMKLVDHLGLVNVALDVVSTRVAEAVAMRAEKGETLSDASLEKVKEVLTLSERLREAVAIEPRKSTNPNEQLLLEQIFRNSQALLFTSGGINES